MMIENQSDNINDTDEKVSNEVNNSEDVSLKNEEIKEIIHSIEIKVI